MPPDLLHTPHLTIAQLYFYSCKLFAIDAEPQVEEVLKMDGQLVMSRKRGQPPTLATETTDKTVTLPDFPDEMSGLMVLPHVPVYR